MTAHFLMTCFPYYKNNSYANFLFFSKRKVYYYMIALAKVYISALFVHSVDDNNRRYYRITIYLENVNID